MKTFFDPFISKVCNNSEIFFKKKKKCPEIQSPEIESTSRLGPSCVEFSCSSLCLRGFLLDTRASL